MLMTMLTPTITFFVLSVFLVIIFFPRTLVFSLSLVIYISLLLFSVVNFSLISGLLALLVLLVYVGAIIIMISYICAVSPNIKYFSSFVSILTAVFVVAFLFLSLVFPTIIINLVPVNDSHITPSFLFTDVGFWFLAVLSLFMVIILIYSTYIRPVASSLRSSSLK